MLEKIFKHSYSANQFAFGKTIPTHTKRNIWVMPVNPKNKYQDTVHQKITQIEAEAIINNHQVMNVIYDLKRFKLAAEKLNLMTTHDTAKKYWRGETNHAGKNIPNGVYELSRPMSITTSSKIAENFTQKPEKLFDNGDIFFPHNNFLKQSLIFMPRDPKENKGTILTVTVPANVNIVKIPENKYHSYNEDEYVILAGTLVRIKEQGTHIEVLTPQEENQERQQATQNKKNQD